MSVFDSTWKYNSTICYHMCKLQTFCAIITKKKSFCLQDKHLSAFGVILDSGICVTPLRQIAVMMSCVMWELVKQVNVVLMFGFWSIFVTLANFPFVFSASVLDIKVMGCLPMESCNKTTVVEFLANKTLYTMKTMCCEEDFCNSCPAVQLSLTPLLFTILLIAQMMGAFWWFFFSFGLPSSNCHKGLKVFLSCLHSSCTVTVYLTVLNDLKRLPSCQSTVGYIFLVVFVHPKRVKITNKIFKMRIFLTHCFTVK